MRFDKITYLSLLVAFFTVLAVQVNAQLANSEEQEEIIHEDWIKIVKEDKLVEGWEEAVTDKNHPTGVYGDFNGNGTEDFCGAFWGVSWGIYLFDDFSGEQPTEEYSMFPDTSYISNEKYKVVLNKGNSDIELIEATSKKNIFPDNDYIIIVNYVDGWKKVLYFENGSFVLVDID
jgi:hypothetical protein